MSKQGSGSKGVLEGLQNKNLNSKEVKNLNSEELNTKRSFSLRPSTVKMLQELKVFIYDEPDITYNEIVDEAIRRFYESKKNPENE